MLGIHFLYKILKERRADYLVRIPKSWFISGAERKEYKKIMKYLSQYGQLPPCPASEPEKYEDHTLEYFFQALKKRYLLRIVQQFKSLEINEDNVEDFLQEFFRQYEHNIASQDGEFIITPSILAKKTKEAIDEIRKSRVIGLYGYPTSYPSLDLITGGYVKGDLFVYVARMKMGKTMYLLNSVLNLLRQGVSCLFISLEMSFQSVIRRLLALDMGNTNFIRQTRIVSSFVDDRLEKINYPLFYINGSILSDIVDILSLINVYKPEIVFIDGAYLLPLKSSVRSEWERATAVIRGLRNISLKTNIPVVITYQLNRQAVKTKEIGTEHIAFTDAVGQSASVVVGIVNNANNPETKKFVVIANREGPADIQIEVNWNWEILDFSETGRVYEEEASLEEIALEEEE